MFTSYVQGMIWGGEAEQRLRASCKRRRKDPFMCRIDRIAPRFVVLFLLTVVLGWATPALTANCNGKVTEVTVRKTDQRVGFRHTGMSANNDRLWITACSLKTDGVICEAWLKLLTGGVLSGNTVTVQADTCKTTTAVSPIVRYIKLRD